MEIRVAINAADVRAEGDRVTAAFKQWVDAGEWMVARGGQVQGQGQARSPQWSVGTCCCCLGSQGRAAVVLPLHGEWHPASKQPTFSPCFPPPLQAAAGPATGHWRPTTTRGGGCGCRRRAARRAGYCCAPRCTTQVGGEGQRCACMQHALLCAAAGRAGGRQTWRGTLRHPTAAIHCTAELPNKTAPACFLPACFLPACLPADIVLNVESEHQGGMRVMLQHLLEFFKAYPGAQLPCVCCTSPCCMCALRFCPSRRWAGLLSLPHPAPLAACTPAAADFETCTAMVEDYVYAAAS